MHFLPRITQMVLSYDEEIKEYAFYIHGLTDVIPEKYSLATSSKAARITDKRVFQLYVRQDLLALGVQEIEKNGVIIRIYDKEG